MKTQILATLALVAFTFSGMAQKKWTLKECVDHAIDHNISIKQSALNVSLSENDVMRTKGNFLPDLNASARPGINFGSSIGQNGARISTDNFRSSFNLSSTTTVFNGFQNLHSYEQAKLGVTSSKMALQKAQDDVSLNVVNAYLNVLFAKENLQVAQVQADISKKQIEQAKSQVEAGAQPRSALLNVEATAANDAQNVITMENTLNIALLRLSQLLQVPAEGFDIAPIDVSLPTLNMAYESPKAVYEKALGNRPEIAKAQVDVEIADLGIKIAKGNFLPSLTFSAGMGSSYQDVFSLPPGLSNDYFFKQVYDNLGYSVGFSLSVPIFNRNQTRASVNRAMINKENSEYTLESQKLQLEQTIQQAFLDAKAAVKTYEAAQTSLSSQQEAFRNAQDRYEFGAMTLFDFDQVRNRLVNAEGALIRAKYDYVFKTKVLNFYFGASIFE